MPHYYKSMIIPSTALARVPFFGSYQEVEIPSCSSPPHLWPLPSLQPQLNYNPLPECIDHELDG